MLTLHSKVVSMKNFYLKKLCWILNIKFIRSIEFFNIQNLFYKISYFKKQKQTNNEFYVEAQVNQFVGLGHMLGNILSSYAVAKRFNLKGIYISPEIENLLQEKFNTKLPTEIDGLIILRNKKIRKITIPRINLSTENGINLFKDLTSRITNSQCVIKLEKDQFVKELFLSKEYLKTLFQKHISEHHQSYINGQYKIGIHIRLGDITQKTKFKKRVLNKNYYNKIIKILLRLESVLKPDRAEFIIFTDDPHNLNLPKFNYEIDQSTNAKEAFIKMSYCDILVCSRSSFSYKSALINKNVIIYPNDFWHSYPKDSRYISVDPINPKLNHYVILQTIREVKSSNFL